MGGTSFDVGVIRDGRARAERGQGDGLRPARARADDRHPHDRRGRRLDRARELGRHPPGRAGERGRRSRARSATAAAATSPRSPTPTSCSAASIPAGLLGVGGAAPLDRVREIFDKKIGAHLGLGAGRGGRRHRARGQRQDGGRHPPGVARSAATTRATSSCSPSAAPARSTPSRSRASWRSPRCSCPRGPASPPRSAASSPTSATTSCKTINQAVLRLDVGEARAHPGGAGGRGAAAARLRGRRGRDGERAARGRHAVRRADARAHRRRSRATDFEREDLMRAFETRVLGALRGRAARDARAGR